METNRVKHRIVIYGKGGVGKSTITTHLSAAYARAGLKVLHIGCDPKMDSSLRLIGSDPISSISEFIREGSYNERTLNDLIRTGKWGIDCIEAGGPDPGKGCSGIGVASLINFLTRERINEYPYDVIIFDVLGDLVCGGFVAPLRAGLADRLYIVASDEPMALYAANNISKVALDYIDDGISLGGMIVNLKNSLSSMDIMKEFSERINVPIIDILPYDSMIRKAEHMNKLVLEYAPRSKAAKRYERLAQRIASPNGWQCAVPTPMGRKEFLDFVSHFEI